MKRIVLLLALAVGMSLAASTARAASIHVLADHAHGHVVIGWGGPGWGWGWGWGWGYPAYGYPYGYGYGYGGANQWARVKTDVEPEEAWLYLDGRLIGTADDFDGFPDFLYLGRGHYRLEFRLPGFETKTVDIDAQPGQALRINDHLQKISGAKEYGTYDSPKIEGGIQRFWAKRRPARQGGYGSTVPSNEDGEDEPANAPGQAPPSGPRGNEGDWRGAPPSGDVRQEPPHSPSYDSRSHLKLHIQPADAAVYIDDRFVGTAGEVNSLERGIPVSPGKHTVMVSRPGYKDRSIDVEVGSGASEPVSLTLTR